MRSTFCTLSILAAVESKAWAKPFVARSVILIASSRESGLPSPFFRPSSALRRSYLRNTCTPLPLHTTAEAPTSTARGTAPSSTRARSTA